MQSKLIDELVSLMGERFQGMCAEEANLYIHNVAEPRALGIMGVASAGWMDRVIDAHRAEISEIVDEETEEVWNQKDVFIDLWNKLYPIVTKRAKSKLSPCAGESKAQYEVYAANKDETEPLFTADSEIEAAVEVDSLNYRLSMCENLDYLTNVNGVVAFYYDAGPEEVFQSRFNLLNLKTGETK